MVHFFNKALPYRFGDDYEAHFHGYEMWLCTHSLRKSCCPSGKQEKFLAVVLALYVKGIWDTRKQPGRNLKPNMRIHSMESLNGLS